MKEMQLDANQVIDDLTQTIAVSEKEKSIMRVQIKQMQEYIEELKKSLPQ